MLFFIYVLVYCSYSSSQYPACEFIQPAYIDLFSFNKYNTSGLKHAGNYQGS